MWHPWRIEQIRYLAVYLVLNNFALVAPLSSPQIWIHSSPMSDMPTNIRAHARTTHPDGVVPHAIPPLPPSESRLKHPRVPSNPQHRISVNPLHPHVTASDRFTSWLTPYGI